LGCASSSVAYAADPNAVAPVYTGTGTGIAIPIGSGGPAVDDGVPAAYKQLKDAITAEIEAGTFTAQPVSRGIKIGIGAALSTGAVQPMYTTCVDGFPCSFDITSFFPGMHEQTTIYCVVAAVQSFAVFDLGTSYETMGTGSVIKAQDAIFAALHGNKSGVDDIYALPWINAQFSSHGYTFYYYAVKPTSTSTFMSFVREDLWGFLEANYVRVSLANGGYGKFTSGGLHATEATGYDDNAGTVTSYDPWSKRSSSSNAACTSTAYGSGTWGCYWVMPQAKYYQAMDKEATGNGIQAPLWY
jgi:hypothetical protein